MNLHLFFLDKYECSAQNAKYSHDKDEKILLGALTYRRIMQHHQSGDIIAVYSDDDV